MKCRICENQSGNDRYTASEMMLGLRDTFQYFQCSECGCLQISEFPDDIHKYYPDEYHSFESISRANFLKNYLRNKRNRYAIFEDSLIGKYLYRRNPEPAIRSLGNLNLTKKSRILDVGCGSGKLLHSLKELGFQNLQGIDPFNEEDVYESNLKILKKTIHEVKGEWDLIMMHHSFEHVPDPLEVLNSISELLSPSGQCLIRIPVVDSYAWENFKENWVQLDAPRHYFLHSEQSMELLANNAGLTIKNIIYDSTAFQFWGSIQYEHDIPLNDDRSYMNNPDDSLFSKEEIENFNEQAEVLNQARKGDQAVFILEKVQNS